MSYTPDKAVHPGRIIAEILQREGMTQKGLSARMGMSEKHLSQIINGEASLTIDTSLLLENALGGSASFWNNLDRHYQETQARIERASLIKAEMILLPNFPYRELAKRGYVETTSDTNLRIANLWKFFGVNSLSYVSTTEAIAFRRNTSGGLRGEAIATWLRCGELELKKRTLPAYSESRLRKTLGQLKLLSVRKPGHALDEATRLLNECGVALIFLPPFAGTRVSGACRWIHKTPVIQLSLYRSWADVFWFDLFHELGHLLLHGKKGAFVEFDEKEPPALRTTEAEADEFARNELIPLKAYARFLASHPTPTKENIVTFARSIGVHEGIVAGRLYHDKKTTWAIVSALRPRLKFAME